MAAYNTAMMIAKEIRTYTGYRRASQEAHALMRQAFNQTGDIDTTEPDILTMKLDPLPTQAKTTAIAEPCEHLHSTQNRYERSPELSDVDLLIIDDLCEASHNSSSAYPVSSGVGWAHGTSRLSSVDSGVPGKVR